MKYFLRPEDLVLDSTYLLHGNGGDDWWLFRYLGTPMHGKCAMSKVIWINCKSRKAIQFVEALDNIDGYDYNTDTNSCLAGYTCVDGTMMEQYFENADSINYRVMYDLYKDVWSLPRQPILKPFPNHYNFLP